MSHSPLRYLYSFLTVANEDSFVRTADRLVVPQPALLYQTWQPEQWLGVPLFERPRRKLVLTCAGTSMHVWCRGALAGLDKLRAVLHSGEMERVSFKLASGSSFGRHVLMPVLLTPSLEPEAPLLDDVHLEFVFGSDEEVFSYVESDRVNLGFVYTPHTPHLSEHHAVYTEEFALACSARVLHEHVTPCTLADYTALFFTTYNESNTVYGLWFKVLFRRTPETTVSIYHVSDLEEVSALVKAGMGQSILPLHAVREAMERGRLQVVRPIATRHCLNTMFTMRHTLNFPDEARDRLLVRLVQPDTTARVQPRSRNLPRRSTRRGVSP